MAAEGKRLQWRRNLRTFTMVLKAIWEMSVQTMQEMTRPAALKSMAAVATCATAMAANDAIASINETNPLPDIIRALKAADSASYEANTILEDADDT
ncbi:MAG: hypothetical protein O7G83_00720 [Proteobacteria bacterium]|nr:hypothetical protein [Pseudomonadota bacterium]